MTPAFRLLAACCRWPDDERRVEAVQAAADSFTDWDGFTALADRHRVEPLAAHGLRAAGIEVLPALAAAAEVARAATLRDLGETLRIAAAFDAAGITHRFLKGIPLGMAAYGTPTLKRSWDIDLLVMPRDTVAAADCLAGLDYTPVMPPRPFDQVEYVRWSAVSKEAEFRSARGTMVELHWRVSDHPALLSRVDAATPARAIPILGERSVATLADGPTLAYLAVHGAAHAWFRLKWIADFNALLESLAPDARAAALADAATRGVGHTLAAAIDLSGQLFRNEPPATDRSTRLLGRLSLAALLAESDHDSAALASRARWRLGGGASFWLAELHVRLRGTLDRVEHPLPPRLDFLYPLLRVPFWIRRRVEGRRRSGVGSDRQHW